MSVDSNKPNDFLGRFVNVALWPWRPTREGDDNKICASERENPAKCPQGETR